MKKWKDNLKDIINDKMPENMQSTEIPKKRWNITGRSKRSRLSALIPAAFAVFMISVFISLFWEMESRMNDSCDWVALSETETGIRELNNNLWLLDLMYFRNLDGNGRFSGNDYYKKSVYDTLKRKGLMNDDGTINTSAFEIPGYSFYLGTSHKAVFTNTGCTSLNDFYGISDTYIKSGCYGDMWLYRDNENNTASFGIDRTAYTNDMGMEYYYIGCIDSGGTAVYSYDTSGHNSYIDELGAEIFYDGSGQSPVPREYGGDYPNSRLLESVNEIYVIPSAEECDALVECYFSDTKDYYIFRKTLLIFGTLIPALFILSVSGFDMEKRRFCCGKRKFSNETVLIAGAAGILIFTISTEVYPDDILTVFFFSGLCTVFAAWELLIFNELIMRIKCGRFAESFLLFRNPRLSRINDKFRQKPSHITCRIIIKTILLLCAVMVFAAFGIIENAEEAYLCVVMSIILYGMAIISDLKAVNILGKYIDEISNGSYTTRSVKQTSPAYYLTEKLNGISVNINTAVENQVRSERMKVDLVTNVSHDIKTPLTSIVSYVDLLSKDESLSPESRSYVQILEQKTDRLKKIVSDLFDLAKATSKTDVDSEEIDAVILINQVLADMGDKIKRYGKTVKTEIYTDEAHFIADGKKMYRTLQNIIDNALKYSLEGTRIFLSVSEEDSDVIIKLKNTSSYEMNFSTDEITERFVRGDCSRTSEGSGLGLSIAKSFTEACGGTFKIQIDGDTFCVNISFPVAEKTLQPDDCENIISVKSGVYEK